MGTVFDIWKNATSLARFILCAKSPINCSIFFVDFLAKRAKKKAIKLMIFTDWLVFRSRTKTKQELTSEFSRRVGRKNQKIGCEISKMKKNREPPAREIKRPLPGNKKCAICHQGRISSDHETESAGKFFELEKDFYAHYFCLLFR